jgi:predicted enzyme related to lactoylglutathione lyase
MAQATGIGGVFFRSGDTVFAPFGRETDYFPPDKQWMINFRVDDLTTLMADLKQAGIAIETRAEWDTPETGRFARIHDPEGNPIELWEPPAS